jgi:hypothetical protein
VISSRHLGLDREDSSVGQFGRKLTQIVDQLKVVIKSGDRLMIFCQFDDLTAKVVKALAIRNIITLQVQGSVFQKAKTLRVFQKDDPGPNDPRVVMLKMDDDQSAGLNLTHLNLAIFVYPLLAANQTEYEAYET